MRRLRNDLAALERLRSESSVFRFSTQGDPPYQYNIVFQGRGLWRDRGKVRTLETHRVEVRLGASYPRTIPELRWITPIYHPNISEIGMVCLGGYGTHWVPSVQLDELCNMLWDMVRYHNYDIRSPYNRDAALWVANQTAILFPTDPRPLRDLRAALGRVEPSTAGEHPSSAPNGSGKPAGGGESAPGRVRKFVERYRRSFSGSGAPEPRRPAADPDGDPVSPRPVADRDSWPRAEPPGTDGVARDAPLNPELQALVAAQAATEVGRGGDGGGGGDAGGEEEVLILETSGTGPPPAQREAPRPIIRTDDIIFIE
jgi:ubiquitin-protein ligase